MTDTANALRHKIQSADELKSVVRTMKALASSSILQYEEAVRSLEDYARTVDLALTVCFRTIRRGLVDSGHRQDDKRTGIIILGTDQGLVGQFNEALAELTVERIKSEHRETIVWVVGERMQAYLLDSDVMISGVLPTPTSVAAITPLIGQLLIETESRQMSYDNPLYLFHNRPESANGVAYRPTCLRLLPLDTEWHDPYAKRPWPTNKLPEVIGDNNLTLGALIREYLFVTMFRACAESLAGENASRLAAMQRAEKNIDELLGELGRSFNQIRQRSIDEELFDVIAGYESMQKKQ